MRCKKLVKRLFGFGVLVMIHATGYAYEVSGGDCRAFADASECIQGKIDLLSQGTGGTLYLPTGVYTFNATLNMKNFVYIKGDGVDATRLLYTGSIVAIDAVGVPADTTPGNITPGIRIIFRIEDLTIDGSNVSPDNTNDPETRNWFKADGIWLGENHRSNPLLNRVKIKLFPRYGIYFKGNEWNVSFSDVELDQNGHDTVDSNFQITSPRYAAINSSGIYKDPSVMEMNGVNFYRSFIEGNGNYTSAAGGVHLQFGTRGLIFRDCIVEGNFGTDQVYIHESSGLRIDGLYLEAYPYDEVAHARVGVEITNSTGSMTASRFGCGTCDPNKHPCVGSCLDALQVKSSPGMVAQSNVYTGPWQINEKIE